MDQRGDRRGVVRDRERNERESKKRKKESSWAQEERRRSREGKEKRGGKKGEENGRAWAGGPLSATPRPIGRPVGGAAADWSPVGWATADWSSPDRLTNQTRRSTCSGQPEPATWPLGLAEAD